MYISVYQIEPEHCVTLDFSALSSPELTSNRTEKGQWWVIPLQWYFSHTHLMLFLIQLTCITLYNS